ncbi:MAG TPA: hypothetical protein PLI27_01340 [Ignavibacteriales bacterium]|nr:hypothetical protein [Ignavibacteriales bacterium]HOL81023.1 hypothetical protein [Ignavibacteriales bacterium]HOM64759.1 hypothetical protein [Ignavibacteriales bacterium]HPD66709.1 hypothetical protein [Ignavibacteriales bacterium]HPP32803.1 hypothetical protein [Ignavibacteriales bacterium]
MIEALSNVFKAFINKTNSFFTKNKKDEVSNDKLEISNTAKAFDVVNKVLDLGNSNRFSEAELDKLNPKEKEEFLKMLANLMKKGIVGYEVLEIKGKPVKYYIVNEIGDTRTYGAKLSKKHYSK